MLPFVLKVARDVAILFFLTFAGGFVVGMSGVNRTPRGVFAIGAANVIFSIVGFVISGSLSPERRWRHLGIVAIVLWLVSVVNVLFLGVPIWQWLWVAPIGIGITMCIGGALSYLFKPPVSPREVR